ncbi:cytochrome b/b6 domain-containing protein [Litorisediminicola beolgyonensis]|uniref:Cytochrome b/b6 domain-containing protein n=1 Tax=Litorisediminicola beolgyonensis TaxID=1173614 RepID=A0ABW3ZF24_9RHOB
MAARNTPTRYGTVTKTLHWATALGIFLAIALGIVAERWPMADDAARATKIALFSAHKTLGVTLLALALVRIAWAVTQAKPAPLHPERRLETLAASTVHWLLYGSLVAVPLTGWLHHATAPGFAPILWPFGQGLPGLAASERLTEVFSALHLVLNWVLGLSIALHVAGALKHAFFDRDATLARMLPGRTEAGLPGRHPGAALPIAAALAVWAAAFGIGAGTGLFSADDQGASAELAEVESQWQVTEGTLAITVQQMGSEVSGQFADWTADIAFEERDAPGTRGSVRVEIATGSLTLGSVTKQATGPDFLATEAHPVAIFEAEIMTATDGYAAEGTLTLSGETVPVTLPFQLRIDGDRAVMEGALTLDRRNFGIGSGMTDPDQLGFSVQVEVSLTATRADPAV